MDRRFGGPAFSAARFLENGEYFNNKGKRDRYTDGASLWGLFQDEIVPFDGFTVWFYHGNAIALYDHVTKAYTLGNAGWNTMTTKTRLNSLPMVYISAKKGVWYNRGELFEDRTDEIMARVGIATYEKYDGWRGANIPTFAVLGASDTGGWSDSPCPSGTVTEEIGAWRKFLAERGIKSYEAFGTTSNVFCGKRWLIVRGQDFKRAILAIKAIGTVEQNYQYVYIPEGR